MNHNIPRPEYPRPQMQRERWLNLNGAWQFRDDPGDEGEGLGWQNGHSFPDEILVPFCRESKASGLERTGRMLAVWYARSFEIPTEWQGQRLFLHFGAADYETMVWIHGQEVGRHVGGHSSFSFEITRFVSAGQSVQVVVKCRDDWWTSKPRGKQSARPNNWGCHYNRTTGIWQTVWVEPVPHCSLERPRITPSVDTASFWVEQKLLGRLSGGRVRAVLQDASGEVTRDEVPVGRDYAMTLRLSIPADRVRLWQPGDGFLYDLILELLAADGTCVDRVQSYAGLRTVCLDGKKFLINGRTVFQRMVLDQGYYPESLLTAPDDAALRRDIELSLAAGFNGARLHQKIFEERFYYHADQLGYLVWGEMPDWGSTARTGHRVNEEWSVNYVEEWIEAVTRDYSHPSLIGWCPLNEQWAANTESEEHLDRTMRALVLAAKAIDRTRPVIDASGWVHRCAETDILDLHDYASNGADLLKQFARLEEGILDWSHGDPRARAHLPYRGQPYWVSEFGGIPWISDPGVPGAWGYGNAPQTLEEFYARFGDLCGTLLDHPLIFGYCYTQLTDVFQEQNGLYTFDRKPKFDPARLAAAQGRRAVYEEGASL